MDHTPRRTRAAGSGVEGRHLILFWVDNHYPSTIDNISTCTTEVPTRGHEIVAKDIRLVAALGKVFRGEIYPYFSVRPNLTYSSYGIRR